MGFKKAEVNNYLLCDTQIENVFISEFAKHAPGDYVKLYLLAYMYMEIGKPIDDDYLAGALGLSAKEVSAGWAYWKAQGIVNLVNKDGHTEIEFVCIKDKLISGSSPTENRTKSAVTLQNDELAKLLRDIESATGRLIDAKEAKSVMNWVSSFGISCEIVLEAYKLCIKKNLSTSFRYVEKVLLDWQNRGIDTVQKLEEYLADTDRHYSFYKKVFNALGFKRNPTKPEMDMMDSWMDDLNCTEDELNKAIKKTTGISNPNLNYINTILVSEKNSESGKADRDESKHYISVDKVYEKLREANAKKTSAKKARVYAAVPGLEKICNEILELNKKITMSFIDHRIGADELNNIKERQQSLQREKQNLLVSHGFTEEDLNPVYTCKYCEDTGILEDGRRCSCFTDRMSEIEK